MVKYLLIAILYTSVGRPLEDTKCGFSTSDMKFYNFNDARRSPVDSYTGLAYIDAMFSFEG
jgi:hypothetical protein